LKLFVGNIREWYNSDSIFGEANRGRISNSTKSSKEREINK